MGCAEDGLVWVWVRGFSWVQKKCRVVWWLVGRVGWLVLLGLRFGKNRFNLAKGLKATQVHDSDTPSLSHRDWWGSGQ